jgi:hypothetical protein
MDVVDVVDVDGMHDCPDGQMDVVGSDVVVDMDVDVVVDVDRQSKPDGHIVVYEGGAVLVDVEVVDGVHVKPDGHIVVVE